MIGLYTATCLADGENSLPASVSGKLTYTFDSHNNGAQLLVTGDAASEIFKLLKNKAGNDVVTLKDGIGVSCYKRHHENYCLISMTDQGIEDLLQIPSDQ